LKRIGHFHCHSIKIDRNEKLLAKALASIFTIYPDPVHGPIAKELAKPALFCLSGNLKPLPKN